MDGLAFKGNQMNREQAKALLPIIQAWAEGKEIQYSVEANKWEVYTGDQLPNITSTILEWRLKPEVKEGWINIYPENRTTPEGRIGFVGDIYNTQQEALQLRSNTRIACVKITYTKGEGL